MPTSTFFRLPEEKRQRLLDAAWTEFTRVRFTEASINKIILCARIPRGSFYQYFLDKEDLFRYLLEGTQNHFSCVLARILVENQGNLFATPLQIFDQFSSQSSRSDLQLRRFIQLLQVNPGLDLHQFLIDRQGTLPHSLQEHMDLSLFRRRDQGFVEQIFILVWLCTGSAIIDTLTHPEERECHRNLLQDRINIIQYGACAPVPTIQAHTS